MEPHYLRLSVKNYGLSGLRSHSMPDPNLFATCWCSSSSRNDIAQVRYDVTLTLTSSKKALVAIRVGLETHFYLFREKKSKCFFLFVTAFYERTVAVSVAVTVVVVVVVTAAVAVVVVVVTAAVVDGGGGVDVVVVGGGVDVVVVVVDADAGAAVASLLQMEDRCSIIFIDDGD